MLLTEYNEKKHIRMEREDAYDEGKAEGKAAANVEAVNHIMKKMQLDLNAACEVIGITVEEYHIIQKEAD